MLMQGVNIYQVDTSILKPRLFLRQLYSKVDYRIG